MAKTRKPSEPQSRLSAQVHRALREGALYVFGVLAVILWFALVANVTMFVVETMASVLSGSVSLLAGLRWLPTTLRIPVSARRRR